MALLLETRRVSEIGLAKELRAWRKARRFTQLEVAEMLGMTRGGYANYEAGTAPVPDDRMESLRKAGFVPGSPMLQRTANIVTYPLAPMRYAGELPAGDWGDPFSSDEFEDVEAKHFKSNRWCCRISGHSCYPALQPGDFCIFEQNMNPPYGKLVVAQRRCDHAATVKHLVYDAGPKLKPVNPIFDEAEADGWGAIAMLVYVEWLDEDGGMVTFYREDGIKPDQLIKYRS